MAITQISRIQHRRGLQQDLPQLATAELGWSIDQRRLFIGRGTFEEGAPELGVTEILTEHSEIVTMTAEIYTFKSLMTMGVPFETGPTPSQAIRRTIQDKFDDIASARDFGAIADGINNDAIPLNRMLERLFGNAEGMYPPHYHRQIYLPAGRYRIESPLNIPPYTKIIGEGKHNTFIECVGVPSVTLPILSTNSVLKSFNVASTDGLHVGMRVRFSGVTFGGVTDMRTYYIGRIIDENNFTISTGSGEYTPTDDSGSSMTATVTSWPAARLVDKQYFYGQDFGRGSSDNSEYHFSNLTFTSDVSTFDNTIFEIDGGSKIYFNNVGFEGDNVRLEADGSGGYDVDRGNGVAIITLNNESRYTNVASISFNQCTFKDHQFAIEVNNGVSGLTVNDCSFDKHRHAIVLGKHSDVIDFDDIHNTGNSDGIPDNIPYGVVISNNKFSNISHSVIDSYEHVFGVTSVGNWFIDVGIGDARAITPQYGTGYAMFPVIEYRSDNNYSIGDVFKRNEMDYAVVDSVKTNGYNVYVFGHDFGTIRGHQVSGTGRVALLPESPTYVSANLEMVPQNYTNMTITYTVEFNNAKRNGVLTVVGFNGEYQTSDEYVTAGLTNVDFMANTTTGDIEYTAVTLPSATSNTAVLTYTINYKT